MTIIPLIATSAQLLEKARQAYVQADLQYRDVLLDIGRTLHDFVLAYLNEGAEVSERQRVERKYTRRRAIEVAAEELKTTEKRINELIVTAMVADLLSQGLCLGNLSHCAIFRFRAFIKRKVASRQNHYGRNGTSIIDAESWIVKPEWEERAKSLFRQAVIEEFSQHKAYDTVKKCNAANPNRLRQQKRKRESAGIQRLKTKTAEAHQQQIDDSMKYASCGDVAEKCLALVNQSEDPRGVALLLLARLQNIVNRKERVRF